MGRSERGTSDSSKLGHLLKFEQASFHPSSESSWKLVLSYPPPNLQAVNPSGSYLVFIHTEDHYMHIPKILLGNAYPESLSGTISKSPCNFQSVLQASKKGTEKAQVRKRHMEVPNCTFVSPFRMSWISHTPGRRKSRNQGIQWQKLNAGTPYCKVQRY